MTSNAAPPAHLWLPFTQMTSASTNARTFVRASGSNLYDADGRELFDAISSVWTTVHGHCHPRIVAAIGAQARLLDHATALGAWNPVAEELASRLARATGLERVLFASDGASAVEAALKIALKYWRNQGNERRGRFVRLVNAYHGDTTGAMSVSDIARFKREFESICFESVPYDGLEDTLERADVAAIVIEPVVQAAAGMRVVPAADYQHLRGELVPLLIVDEIATGFGRTGPMFAFEHLGVSPDIVCLGKSLSGGTLALSATVASRRVFEAFAGDVHDDRHFFHGHSFAANPIACAAALASLDIFEQEDVLARCVSLRALLCDLLEPVRRHAAVRAVHGAGLMWGIEVDETRMPVESGGRSAAWAIADALYERGHFTRPIGNVVQLVPPLSSTSIELEGFIDALIASLPR